MAMPKQWQNVEDRQAPLAGGGGPPHDDVMNARIDRLDRVVERIEDDITSIKVSIGKVETEMKHVATKTWVLAGALGTVLAILGGVWWILQQYLSPILQHLSK